MTYSVNITVNLPDDLEVDLPAFSITTAYDIGRTIEDITRDYAWTSLVIIISNHNPPTATKTFIEPLDYKP